MVKNTALFYVKFMEQQTIAEPQISCLFNIVNFAFQLTISYFFSLFYYLQKLRPKIHFLLESYLDRIIFFFISLDYNIFNIECGFGILFLSYNHWIE